MYATLPYAVQLANDGYENAISTNKELRLDLNVIDGTIVYRGVTEAFGMKWEDSHKYIK
ncbi:MAG TPA: hypothetical protein VFD13_08500 [Candidatus Kapabacteria bacterium]|nr:hypothetical protein [Candidatus Kapabacteria bacterium]